jgi:hypothetical protein
MAPSTPEADAVRARLEESVGPVLFSDLRAHFARDAVFLVAAGESLVACGVAVAMNDVTSIQRWLGADLLRRPTPEEQSAWAKDESRQWLAIVVQPFVLVQDAAGQAPAP